MRAFFIGLVIFLYGCGAIVENGKCNISLEKSVAWRNLMPSLGKKRKMPPLIVKVYLKEEGCESGLSVKEAKIFYKDGFCESRNVSLEKEQDNKIVIVIRDCNNVPFEINSLKIKIVLEDNKQNSYKIETENLKIKKVY